MKHLIKLLISIGISFAILAILMQAVTSGVDDEYRPSVTSVITATSIMWLLTYVGLYLFTLLLRAIRYQLLIRLSGETSVPTLKQMIVVTGIRNMIVDMLPARIGELGYVGILNRVYSVKLEHCLSSLSISVVFDLIALMFVVLLIILKQFFMSEVETWALAAFVSSVLIVLVAISGLFLIFPRVITFIENKFSYYIQKKIWIEKFMSLMSSLSESIILIRQAGEVNKLLLLSITIRIFKYLGFYILFIAVTKSSFTALAQLEVEKVISALIGGELGASLPIPTFMSFGAYEAGTALVFKLLGGINQAEALVAMLSLHIWSQVIEYILGAGFVMLLVISYRNNFGTSLDMKKAKSFKRLFVYASSAIIFFSGVLFLAWEIRAAKKTGVTLAPSAGKVAEDVGEWKQLSKNHVSNINGFVVFSSNRNGNHDIYKLELSNFELSKVTNHKHTETYPRISPSGDKIIFSRAHQVWVSQRNSIAWDIYLLDLKTGKEKFIANNSTAPHWIDETTVSYLKNATTVIKTNINTLQSVVHYKTGENNQMPKNAHLQNPKINPITDQLVFTGRQNHIGINSGHWGTAITDKNGISQHKGLFNGCEIAWTNDGSGLYQVTKGGRNNGLRIININPETFETSTMIDLLGEFSHEYWPKDSNNGDYIIFGASRGASEHEHDKADYEIFLWKRGSDPSRATRLTFHTGNDNWPDVYIRQ